MARGFSQIPGADYDETFSPVVRGESLRTMFALSAQNNLPVHQMDVETAFLNGILEDDVYMTQPEGSEEEGQEHLVCRLKRSLYGLKQSPRCWNQVLDVHLRDFGFYPLTQDPCIYKASGQSTLLLVAVYVDDLLIAGANSAAVNSTKVHLTKKFRTHDLGLLEHFLGIHVRQTPGRLWIGQSLYIRQILSKFGMTDSKPVSTPADSSSKLTKRQENEESADQLLYQAAVGCLLYLSTKTRPDISFAVGNVARYCSDPGTTHWTAVKRVMRYLQGTDELGILYQQCSIPCIGYSDADWGGSLDDRRSTSGYLFIWAGGAVSWKSVRQKCVALSSAAQEAIWVSQLISEMASCKLQSMEIMEDNQSAIEIAKNPKCHGRTKHIDIRHHFVRDLVTQGSIHLAYCPTKEMPADLLSSSEY